ncbi:MAG: hypothetical protein A3F53_02095 [Candidatus Zambryskibacteria bacterium RIFCSPHIGHO2_12_FULL_48_10]|uniref:Ribosomal protein L9 domain-containing protein n=1 Tax=Candidatus Zambryskibacteria bacterium RIFCSPHIGHO2_01_FULL_46_25 TaxID=1802738 RepID=A0A1G2SZ54_9BACT|nr:MAG: hypothetical protein A2838_01565 [Candidatus Zambryskibacteria bacterium RIFCSPHIGHO2_01_FULL_46_25]OHB01292.1 MAG: hypothetical protein A3F53_02095 [Candidatus Zambryskibacteria bacterium RIFCSPHIGHO2_12_FULL_48_10]OHB06813.1 MAG: hypothetical protein A3A31_00705 [Candidatus Zambryskibacteria bacterium RIFCSPLOWO2_01_FULL_48_25]
MKVIFLKDVKGTGRKFEERQVSDGYAINFLIPNKLAVVADGPGLAAVRQLKAQEEKYREAEDKRIQEKQAKREEKRREKEEALEKLRREERS